MAKLNNVKVLDMVGGEITKIAYDGAEYTKVDGSPIVGDLIKAKKGWDSCTTDGFYKCAELGGEGDARVDTDAGYRSANFRKYYEVFRKTLATTPPIEERVSALETRVDAIDSRLGNAKTPVDEPLKVGDYAKVIGIENTRHKRGSHRFEVGAIVKLYESFSGGFKCEKLDGNRVCYENNVETTDLIRATDEEVAQAKAELAEKQAKDAERKKWASIGREVGEFKKGDIVRSAKYNDGHYLGTIGEYTGGKLVKAPYKRAGERDDTVSIEEFFEDVPSLELIVPVEQRFDLTEVTA